MKVLVISQYFYPENFRINDLCNGLKDKGIDVTVLTAKPNYPRGKFFEGYSFFTKNFEIINDIKVYRSYIVPRGDSNKLSLFINYVSFVFFGLLRLATVKDKFDRVFVYAPSPITVGFIGMAASAISRSKSYIWVHDLWPESVKDAGGINNKIIIWLINLMTKIIYKSYNKVLVQSPYFIEYINKQGVLKDKIIYYPSYAEDLYLRVDNKKISANRKLKLLFAGNIGYAQNLEVLVKSAKILSKKKLDFQFIIVGDGRDRLRIKNEINKNKLQDFFNFLGPHPLDKMPHFFSNCDALLVTLRKSYIFSLTIPGKLQSYLASGKPIIGSLDGIGNRIIKESKSGFVSNSNDHIQLAKNILKFSNLNNEQYIKMGNNARNYYLKEFDRETLLNKLIDIFGE